MDKITIKELAELADVDRKTVYNYYEGVYDILDELENELVARFERVVESLDYNVGNPLKVFEALTNMLSSDLELYGRLMQVGVQTRLIEKIGNYLREKVRGAIAKKGGRIFGKDRACRRIRNVGHVQRVPILVSFGQKTIVGRIFTRGRKASPFGYRRIFE